VALHGSWNRTRKDGYKVVSLHFAESGSVVERDFLWGFLRGEDVIGRPVDVAQGPDGAVYVSDDYAGSVFRLGYGEEAQRIAAAARGAARGAGGGGVVDLSGEARGAALWERNRCATCHDPNAGIPGMVTRDLTGLARRLSEEQIVRYLAAPTPPMPLFALSEAERRDLARYLRATYR
jgi:mono/diheme cytochrome c family protein